MRHLSLLLLLACDPAAGTVEDDEANDSAVESDTDVDADTDSDTDVDADADSDTDTDTASAPVVRFIAMGDGGEGNDDQHRVADKVAEVCAAQGCDFVLYLGDNIYDTGVESSTDPQFDTKFEVPYQPVDLDFWVVLGNHDLGGDGLGIDLDPNKASYEIEYSQYSDKWNMPAAYYSVPEYAAPRETVHFFGLDTTEIMFGWNDGDQRDWFATERDASTSPWKIAFGHHPYISNGRHGNAGNYEGIEDWVPFSEIPRGDYVKAFMDDEICGKVDAYFSGHDHNLQWLDPVCGTQFVVAGAAAKTTEWGDASANDVQFQVNGDDLTCGGGEGFVWVELDGDTMTGAVHYWEDDCSGGVVWREQGPFTYTRSG